MDINEVLDKMYGAVNDYCTTVYSGKSIDHIFASTAADLANADDPAQKMFHELCFRHVLQIALEEREEHFQKQIDELKKQLDKMANVIDILNQDGASK